MANIGNIDVGSLALGANVFGWTADEHNSFEVLDAFLENGGKLIDTADGYSHWIEGNTGGESERMIGKWIDSRGARSRINVATKVSTHPEFPGLSPLNIRRAADASLDRLGVDVIDLYWAHFDDPDTPIVETAAAFSELQQEGKIRAIGLSNYTPERINEWVKVAKIENLALPVALQPHYNLVEREFEESGLRNVAYAEGLGVFPYYSLAKGFLTGKYRSENDAHAMGASPRAAQALQYLDDRGRALLRVLDEIAASHDVSVTAVSLAWLRQQPTVAAPVASARNKTQLHGLMESTRLVLSHEDIMALNQASSTLDSHELHEDASE